MMKRLLTLLALLLGLSLSAFAQTQSKLPPCPGVDNSKHKGTYTIFNGGKYIWMWKVNKSKDQGNEKLY